MTRHNVFFAIAVLISIALAPAPAAAQQQIVPPSPILINSPIVINNSAGDQTDPHVSKDLVCYTDVADNRIHYYNFSTAVDSVIPPGTSIGPDTLSDVTGKGVCFSRQEPNSFEIGFFDTTTSTLTEVDSRAVNVRLGCAVGGNTLVYVDFGTGTLAGDCSLTTSSRIRPLLHNL